jgi:hypothetical protein
MTNRTVDEIAKEMREAAEKASAGECTLWREEVENRKAAEGEMREQIQQTDPFVGVLFLLNASGKCPATTGCGPKSEDNADHLIASQPQNVLAILDERDALKAKLAEAEEQTALTQRLVQSTAESAEE